MKKIMLIILMLASTLLLAQEKTIFGENADISHGGFGAPVIKMSSINGEFGVLCGARGGWIINHQVSLGLGAYALVTNHRLNPLTNSQARYLDFNYGGFELEYVLAHNELLHLTFIGLIGGGESAYRFNKLQNFDDDKDSRLERDNFFVGEPTVNAEINVTSFFRINVGAGYRLIAGADNGYITDSKLSGFSGIIQFKFGSF